MTPNNFVACFFAGAFFANFVPHFVKGICGDRFPTPFAKPPGKGLSSALVNVAWSLLNLVVAYVLVRGGRLPVGGVSADVAFFAGFAVLSLLSSVQFAKKDAG